jgi:hypothetical protein
MNKPYEYMNLMAKEVIKTLNTYLNPVDVIVLTSLETDEHYTVTTIIPNRLSEQIYPIATKLKSLDETLILNEPSLYHFTTFWCSLNIDLEKIKKIIEELIKSHPLSFEIKDLLFGPAGICLKLYPMDDTFNLLREKLYAVANKQYFPDELTVTSWISLARYSQTPSIQVKNFIQNSNVNLGFYSPETIDIYKSKNKLLLNAEKIYSIKNK